MDHHSGIPSLSYPPYMLWESSMNIVYNSHGRVSFFVPESELTDIKNVVQYNTHNTGLGAKRPGFCF